MMESSAANAAVDALVHATATAASVEASWWASFFPNILGLLYLSSVSRSAQAGRKDNPGRPAIRVPGRSARPANVRPGDPGSETRRRRRVGAPGRDRG